MTTARQWAIGAAGEIASEAVSEGLLPLAEFQARAAQRLAQMIRDWGGALLADGVGLGKTRVALTVASAIAREQRMGGARGAIWCCVPARIAAAWRTAIVRAQLDEAIVVTHASFSLGRTPDVAPLLIVVDEAHRFRNPGTRRHRTLAAHSDVPLLLLTATPIANSLADLWTLLELFLDSDDVRHTFGWDLRTARRLAMRGEWDPVGLVREVTVRRTEPPDTAGFGRRPSAQLDVVQYDPSPDEAWLWTHLEQHIRALRMFDDSSDWPRGLFVEHVLRRWESGPDALLETVVELQAYAQRRIEAHACGRSLDRASFRSIFGAEPSQEVFPFLYPASSHPEVDESVLRGDLDRLAELRVKIEAVCAAGLGRDGVVLDLASHGKLLVFTSYRRAADGLFDQLVSRIGPKARVGLITGARAVATGLGRVPPEEVLRRFSPRSHGVKLRVHETLQILVATDCISEGVNLQDCGRVVLADLPYSPLGIEQRIGRLIRPGGPHERVNVYLPRPLNWADSLGMRRRLQSKVALAREAGLGPTAILGAPGQNPFEALTSIEAIARLPGGSDELPRSLTLVEQPTTWLVLARIGERPWFFTVGEPLEFATMLCDLAWDGATARECEIPEAVRRVLSEHQAFLRAALAAPASLEIDAPEAVAWRVLLASTEALELSKGDLADLRERLLRRHRQGVRRRLAMLVTEHSMPRLLRYVRAIPPTHAAPRVALVTCLGVASEH